MTSGEASHVAGYGLQPWQVAEIAIAASQYVPAWNDSTLAMALYPAAPSGSSGGFAPVSSVALVAPDAPFIGDGASIASSIVAFVVNGTAGILDGNVHVQNGVVVTLQNANK